MDNTSEEGKRTGISTFGCAAIVFAIVVFVIYLVAMIVSFSPVTKTGAGEIRLTINRGWEHEVVATGVVTDTVDSTGYFEFRNADGETVIFGQEQTGHRPLGSEQYYIGSGRANGSWSNDNKQTTYHEFAGATPYKVTTWSTTSNWTTNVLAWLVVAALCWALLMLLTIALFVGGTPTQPASDG